MRNGQPLRVLLVDDDMLVREFLRDQVETAGHLVVGKARDGAQAVAAVKSLAPEIVIMDIAMPGMDGLTATETITRECPVPVILLTAHGEEDFVLRGSRTGAAAYLVKPTTVDELSRTIVMARARFADWMELRRLNEELRKSLAEIKTLRGLLPICSNCKSIRDEKGYWKRVETYLRERTDVEFTHGICDACVKLLYPDLSAGTDNVP